MEVQVLLFGPYAAAAGSRSVQVTVPSVATYFEVLGSLGAQHEALRPLLVSARLAVNQAFVQAGTVIGPGDELAVIGMVSGG